VLRCRGLALESLAGAQALLDACISELSDAGVPVTGELLHSYGTHTDVAAQILHRATDLGAGAIVLGPETRHAAASSVNAYIAAHAPGHVIIVNPAAGALGRPRADGPIGDPPVGAGFVRASSSRDAPLSRQVASRRADVRTGMHRELAPVRPGRRSPSMGWCRERRATSGDTHAA
jgi:hypothetical protein